ncbi:MAG TPA: hypothetical protein PKL15_05300 [Saprospiraceae bacterium]|nr:hypothetical protein [Saprospiraceae bacterium]
MKNLNSHPVSELIWVHPEDVLKAPFEQQMHWLYERFGDRLYPAFDYRHEVASPVWGEQGPGWVKRARTVGINVRTIGSFWQIIPYMLTQPAVFDAVHILPIWEPGVVASLYGPASWNINPEFYSSELARYFPELDTVEKQLKVVVNLLHLGGRVVGMDVVPHTDRYSEMALANPSFFEWLQRKKLHIIRHDEALSIDVQELIFRFLQSNGPAVPGVSLPDRAGDFFSGQTEEERLLALFGEKYDYQGRLTRRKKLVQSLYEQGFETVPATMGPPYRGLEVDPAPDARVVDDDGREWRDYRLTHPQPMSRVFGPLARYKLYHSLDDNRDWALDFDRPNKPAWEYVCRHYEAIQKAFGFDFMRGDMSHVQMRPEGVPPVRDHWYDLLGAVKQTVAQRVPQFAYFAESFLAPPNTMAYGDECEHLEASLADSTLGNLQSEPMGSREFVSEFARYRQLVEAGKCTPCFTLITADKDDPRFDAYYLDGNEVRYFIALFLTDMPAYMGLGYECRDPHPIPAPNEFYSKLYVFHVQDGPKSTTGPYRWGQNHSLYRKLGRQKQYADNIFASIAGQSVRWISPPDPEGGQKVIAWTPAGGEEFLFVANMDTRHPQQGISLPGIAAGDWQIDFSTEREQIDAGAGGAGSLDLLPGEGLVFRRYKA